MLRIVSRADVPRDWNDKLARNVGGCGGGGVHPVTHNNFVT